MRTPMKKIALLAVALFTLLAPIASCGDSIVTQTDYVTLPGPATTVTEFIVASEENAAASQTGSVIPFQGITKILSITPPSPASLHIYEKITVTFEYVITDPAGGRIRAIGYNGTCGLYAYDGSDIIPAGRGTLSRSFFVTSVPALTSPVIIDQIYMQMCDSAMTTVFEVFLPVDYKYIP